MPLPTSPASSLSSSAPLFQEDGYSSTSEEESEVTFTHGRCNGTFSNQHAERTSTPTPFDYTTQGDPDASPSSLSKTHDINDEFLGTKIFLCLMAATGGYIKYTTKYSMQVTWTMVTMHIFWSSKLWKTC